MENIQIQISIKVQVKQFRFLGNFALEFDYVSNVQSLNLCKIVKKSRQNFKASSS